LVRTDGSVDQDVAKFLEFLAAKAFLQPLRPEAVRVVTQALAAVEGNCDLM
jgi:hypothetical protein